MSDETDDNACEVEGCDRVFATPHGLTMHMRRTHKAPAAAANDAFERVGRATEALFPGGIPASRIIEIAELQKVMLRVVVR